MCARTEDGSGIISRLSHRIAIREGIGPALRPWVPLRGRKRGGAEPSCCRRLRGRPTSEERTGGRSIRRTPYRFPCPDGARRRVGPAPAQSWCERGDSNPHGLPHWHLKPARLPVPPLSRLSTGPKYIARPVNGFRCGLIADRSAPLPLPGKRDPALNRRPLLPCQAPFGQTPPLPGIRRTARGPTVRTAVRYAAGAESSSSDWKRRTWYAESPNATPMAVRRFR